MQNWTVQSVDRTTLPTDMLPMFKTHCRVTFADDDEYLKLCLVRSLDLFERHSGWNVFTRAVTWSPEGSSSSQMKFPVAPVDTFTVTDSTATDVTAEYRVQPDGFDYWLVKIDGGAIPSGLTIAITSGFLDQLAMPPSVVDIGFRIGAHLYENRESVTSYSLDQVPQWMNDLLLGNWIPRA